MEANIAHRPGFFKQPNKTHKTGRHRSKGFIAKELKGKTDVKTYTKKQKAALRRQDKKNQLIQIRKQKREEVLQLKRKRGVAGSPPFLVTVLSATSGLDASKAVSSVFGCCDDDIILSHYEESCVAVCSRFKQRFEFLFPNSLTGVLDCAKLSDCLMIILSFKHDEELNVDEFAEKCISCIFYQGFSSVIICCQDIKLLPLKKQADAKKYIMNLFESRFPDQKVHLLDDKQDGISLLRTIGSQKLNSILYRELRPNMFASSAKFNENAGTLELTGYLRGAKLSPNQLIHIPGYGNFQMSQIEELSDPHPINGGAKKVSDSVDMKSVKTSDPNKQETLQMAEEIDPMDNEQTWPTEEELRQADAKYEKKMLVKKVVPKGFSDYQSAWITEDLQLNDSKGDDDDDEDDDDDDEDDDDDDCSNENDLPMDCSENEGDDDENKEENGDDDDTGSKINEDEMETMSIREHVVTFDVSCDEEEKKRRALEMLEFPDLVDTPLDVAARIRFQKYRGLSKKSNWDVNEDLPLDYGRIVRFNDFRIIRKRVIKKIHEEENNDDKVEVGSYVTVTANNVSPKITELINANQPIIAFGLLPFEQKISVVHFLIHRNNDTDDVIKSKDPIIFHVGCHRFKCRPIYSQHSRTQRHKFERYLRPGNTMVATVFAPVIFPPASVLMFKPNKSGDEQLVGSGTVLSADPNRMIIKKIVLYGHPFKVNRNIVVVRGMFHNREDILWFKKVELRTNSGRKGHIKEALGTHGIMKATFDQQIQSDDTIFMNLYKRVYPKWSDFTVEQS